MKREGFGFKGNLSIDASGVTKGILTRNILYWPCLTSLLKFCLEIRLNILLKTKRDLGFVYYSRSFKYLWIHPQLEGK